MNKDGFIYTVVFTFIGAFVFVFGLSLANGVTRPLVEANQKIDFYTALLTAAGIETDGDVEEAFEEKFPGVNEEETELFQTTVDGETVLIRRFSGSGLWGTITGVLAVNEEIDRIQGLDIISHNETPGLGGRIEEQWFIDQFRNESIASGSITVKKGTGEGGDQNSENQQVDGITGASLTSKSMETIVNNTIELIKDEKGGM